VELHGAGTIAYYCRFHPNMTGTIKVLAAEQPQ
jgi:plastocyanin